MPGQGDGEEKRSGALWVGISNGRERKWKVGKGLYIIRYMNIKRVYPFSNRRGVFSKWKKVFSV